MESDKIQCETRKQRYWRNHLSCWEESGLTQREYCLGQGIAISTFSYWKRKCNKVANDPVSTVFYPLTINANGTKPDKEGLQSGIRLFLCKDKFKIDLEKEFSQTTLRRLIATLEII